jgi:phosphoribosylaminoimidazole-succinocarboxamide synthase
MPTIQGLQLEYEGSVKNVFSNPAEPNYLWFQFTDDYSVFDWGKMPDEIANKGKSLTLLGAYLFGELAEPAFWAQLPRSPHLKKFSSDYLDQRWQHLSFSGDEGLARTGLTSHFVALVDINRNTLPLNIDTLTQYAGKDALLKVLRAQVNRPSPKLLFGQNIYFYNAENFSPWSKRLIPLEVVFRFGMGKGSSLSKRLHDDPHYIHQLGFPAKPAPGEWFDHPVLEFFSKLEPKDRFVSWQEATMLSGLNAALFEELAETAIDIALALHHLFAEKGLELWDGKLEFILQPSKGSGDSEQEAKILLADSIGPDELRLVYRGQQISKEFIRQYYRNTSWAKSLEKALEIAGEEPGRDWKDICLHDLKEAPPHLSSQMKWAADRLYGCVANQVIGRNIFADQPSLDQLVSALDTALSATDGKD